MDLKDCPGRREEAARLLNERESRQDGVRVANSLSDGLSTLRNLLFTRIHQDVELKIGVDSMLLPVSPLKSEQAAKLEIELFEIAESASRAQARGYVKDRDWYLPWLSRLRLGADAEDSRVALRLKRYLEKDDDARRLSFSGHLEHAYPEARRAPLVLYRLFPLSVGIATALAFGAPLDANELRNQQMFWLPSIQDCHECHGSPLENGEKCRVCGNPVWTHRWLTVAD
jgi:hypothetical protein